MIPVSRSNVVEYVSAQRTLREGVGIAFVYFDYQSPAMQDMSEIILIMMKQLCRRKDNIPPAFLRIKQGGLDPSAIGNQYSFVTLAQDFDEVFLIIDALDERLKDKRHHMLGFIKAIGERLPRAKTFVTSRRETDISEAFKKMATPTIQIEAKSIAADINKYVRNETQRLRDGYDGKRLYLISDALEKKIIIALTEKAHGM
jgi:ankyrin repeat domain-containing protein 50